MVSWGRGQNFDFMFIIISIQSFLFYATVFCWYQIGDFPMDCPLHDSLLRVHYKGTVLNDEKRIFYDTRVDNDGQPLKFCSGEGLVSLQFEHK